MKYSEVKPIVAYWHGLHYSDQHLASIEVLGIPPVWIDTVKEVISCLKWLKENTIYSYPFILP